MCGLTGLLNISGGVKRELAQQLLQEMANTIAHRGPNSDGYWVDSDAGVGLAHRRLAIVDLSPAGAQPMVSGSGRYV